MTLRTRFTTPSLCFAACAAALALLPSAGAQQGAANPAKPGATITAPQVISSGSITGCKDVKTPQPVEIEFTVGIDGKTSGIHVIKAPTPEIGACAAELVRTMVFSPPLSDGKPFSAGMRVTVNIAPPRPAEGTPAEPAAAAPPKAPAVQ